MNSTNNSTDSKDVSKAALNTCLPELAFSTQQKRKVHRKLSFSKPVKTGAPSSPNTKSRKALLAEEMLAVKKKESKFIKRSQDRDNKKHRVSVYEDEAYCQGILDSLMPTLKVSHTLDGVNSNIIDEVTELRRSIERIESKVPFETIGKVCSMANATGEVLSSSSTWLIIGPVLSTLVSAYLSYAKREKKYYIALGVSIGSIIILSPPQFREAYTDFFNKSVDILKKRVFKQETAEAKTEGISSTDFTTIGGIILSAVTCGCGFNIPSSKHIFEFVKSLGHIGRITESLSDMWSRVADLFVRAVNWCRTRLLGMSRLEYAVTSEAAVNAWCDKIDAIMDKQYHGKYEVNKTHADDLWLLNIQGKEFLGKGNAGNVLPKSVKAVITRFQGYLTKLMVPFGPCNANGNGPRQDPMVVLIHGRTATLKSTAMYPLAHEVFTHIVPTEKLEELNAHPNDFVYNRMHEQQFWDGYRGQMCTMVDEFGQSKDLAGQADSEAMEAIRMGNMFPFPLHMAQLELKDCVNFTSTFCLLTTNMSRLKFGSINCEEALERRCWKWRIIPAPDFCANPDASVEDRVFDMDKVKAIPMTKEIYNFIESDVAGRPLNGLVYSWKDFVGILVKEYKRKEQINLDFQKMLDDELNLAVIRRKGGPEFVDAKTQGTTDDLDSTDDENGVANYNKHVEEFEDSQRDIKIEDISSVVVESFDSLDDFLCFTDNEELVLHTDKDNPRIDPDDFTNFMFEFKRRYKHMVVDAENLIMEAWGTAVGFETKPASYLQVLYLIWSVNPKIWDQAIEKNCMRLYLKRFLRSQAWIDLTSYVPPEPQKIPKLWLTQAKALRKRVSDWFLSVRLKIASLESKYPMASIFFAVASTVVSIGALVKTFMLVVEAIELPIVNKEGMIAKPIKHHIKDGFSRTEVKQAIITDRKTGIETKLWLDDKLIPVLRKTHDIGYLDHDDYLFASKHDKEEPKVDIPIDSDNEVVTEKYDSAGRSKHVSRPHPVYKGVRPIVAQTQGCSDANSFELGQKLVRKSSYTMYTSSEEGSWKYLGSCLFLKENIMVMPAHFKLLINQRKKFMNISLTFSFQNVTGEKSFECSESDVLDKCFVPEGWDNKDLCITRVKGMHIHANIIRHFIKSDILNDMKNLKVCIVTPSLFGPVYSSGTAKTIGSINVRLPDSNRFQLGQSVHYEVSTFDGDCGSVVLLVNASVKEKIIGIHTAGKFTGGGICPTITQQMLSFLEEGDCQGVEEANVDFDLPWPGNFRFVRRDKAPSMAFITQIQKSPLHGLWGVPLTAPSRMRVFTNADGLLVNPAHKAIAKYGTLKECKATNDELRAVCSFMAHKFTPTELFNTVSFEEAILGDPLNPYFRSIPRNTSAGYPYVLRAKPGHKGKQAIFGKDHQYDLWTQECIDLRRKVDADIAAMKDGGNVEYIFLDILKDERRKLKKVAEGATRLVSGSPVDQTVLLRMHFIEFLIEMMEGRIDNFSAVGINPYSASWHKLALRLQEKGDNILAFDVAGLDTSHIKHVQTAIFDYIINPTFEPDDSDIRRKSFETCQDSLHIFGDVIYQWVGKLPSGCTLTTYLNTLYVLVCLGYCWVRLNPRGIGGLDDLLEHLYLIVYGDDSLVSVSDGALDFFNYKTIPPVAQDFGLTFTPAKKGEFTDELANSITDVDFLKRGFRYDKDLGRFVAPLELEVILEMPYWTKKGALSEQIVRDNVQTCLMELSLHGKEIYDKWAPQIITQTRIHMCYTPPITDRLTLLWSTISRTDYY